MKKKVIINSIFLILAVIALAFSVYLLSWLPSEDLLVYYVLIVPLLLLIILFAVKIIISLKLELNKTYKIICRVCNAMICAIFICAGAEFLFINIIGSYRSPSQSESYQYCNSSNFVDYEENAESEYSMAYVTVLDIFNSKNINVSKMIDSDEKICVLVIEMSKIDTNSFILKNLKYLIYKAVYFKDKEVSKNDNIIYYYDKRESDHYIGDGKMMIMGKTKDSFVFINVEIKPGLLPIDKTKALEYAKEMLNQE